MYQVRVLSNGIRVVSENINYVKSISIGVWIGNGSRYETENQGGISHYIEHMLFKGTKKRSAYQIAWEIDSVGGFINAFTGREQTCYYTQTLDSHAYLAIDILSDMLFSSTFQQEYMDLERQVIIEEINMYEDNPEDLVHELIMEAAWGDSSLGKSILGTPEVLKSINSDDMQKYIKQHYTSQNIVISMTGNINEDIFLMLEEKFGSQKLASHSLELPLAEYGVNSLVKEKDVNQVQLLAGFRGIDTMDNGMHSLLAINNIFGNGMSSRLFQNIREKTGLVYSIYSNCIAFMGTGMFHISVGTSPEHLNMVCELIAKEWTEFKKNKLNIAEVDMAKEQLKGNYILAFESTGSRMQYAGRNLLIGKPLYTQEEILEQIDKVSVESIGEMIDRVFDTDTLCVAAVGAVDSVDGLFK